MKAIKAMPSFEDAVEFDIYREEAIEASLDDDEISFEEEQFMLGYLGA